MAKEDGRTLVEIAADKIIEEIRDKDMKAGDRLPNEYQLAEELGVSRSTVREAIRRLVSRNVLEVRQGSGTFVSEKHGIPEDPLGLMFIGGEHKVALELLDVRLMLEPEICALVAAKATEEQVAHLREMADEMERLIRNNEPYGEVDISMHSYIAECSGNSVLGNLIPIITSSIRADIRATNDEHRLHTLEHHRQFVEAIARHDPIGARASMVTHLNVNRDYMARQLEQNRKKE